MITCIGWIVTTMCAHLSISIDAPMLTIPIQSFFGPFNRQTNRSAVQEMLQIGYVALIIFGARIKAMFVATNLTGVEFDCGVACS